MNFNLADFTGPLDLLLHLLNKNQMEIQNIEISSITEQYMAYIDAATVAPELEYMSEFIVMAATLLLIKSGTLLPSAQKELIADDDPKAELIERLLEYKKIKYISDELNKKQGQKILRYFRNVEVANTIIPPPTVAEVLGNTTIDDLHATFEQLMRQQKLLAMQQEKTIDPEILKPEVYTIEQKSKYILEILAAAKKTTFFSLCYPDMPKSEFITTFMTLLELVHKKDILIFQNLEFNDIEIKGTNYETN
ncbi:segregation and condensation protein A [Candidatus Epulonipiscium viviparus]|uniref:segregation and condensation protein A n=1 Tax=Candidatus Epulonipiscium viviparus TaxID=420336 RepID=UPI0027380B2A|nr:segregation/condensation protein A [Candidatus Epulopiscium viviparus]